MVAFKVSVLIVAGGRKKLLLDVLRSIYNSNFKQLLLEIVVVFPDYFIDALEMIKQGVDVFGGPDRTREDATNLSAFWVSATVSIYDGTY